MKVVNTEKIKNVTVSIPVTSAAPVPHRVAAGTGKRTDHLNKAIKKA